MTWKYTMLEWRGCNQWIYNANNRMQSIIKCKYRIVIYYMTSTLSLLLWYTEFCSWRRAPGPFRSGHLSGWHETIQRQVWSCSEMCLNLCHVLVWWVWNWSFSAFVYTYWLQVMEHLDCHDTMDWSLESPAPLVKRPVCWFVFYVKNGKVGVTHVT